MIIYKFNWNIQDLPITVNHIPHIKQQPCWPDSGPPWQDCFSSTEPNWHVSAHLFGGRIFRWNFTDQTTEQYWWFQPNWKILVKLDDFSQGRGENTKYLKPPTSWKLVHLLYYWAATSWNHDLSNNPNLQWIEWTRTFKHVFFTRLSLFFCFFFGSLVWLLTWNCYENGHFPQPIKEKSGFEEASDLTCESDEDQGGIHHL